MMTSRGKGRFSAHILKEGLLEFFDVHRLYPKGMVRSMECVEAWALRSGKAMQRLVALLFEKFVSFKVGLNITCVFLKYPDLSPACTRLRRVDSD